MQALCSDFVLEGRWILAGGETTGTAFNTHPSPGGATDQPRSVAPPGLGVLLATIPGGSAVGYYP